MNVLVNVVQRGKEEKWGDLEAKERMSTDVHPLFLLINN